MVWERMFDELASAPFDSPAHDGQASVRYFQALEIAWSLLGR
jgi:hypothetical protein